MRRHQLEHAIRTACQIIQHTEVIVVGSPPLHQMNALICLRAQALGAVAERQAKPASPT